MFDLIFGIISSILLILMLIIFIKGSGGKQTRYHNQSPPPVRLVYDNTKLNPWCVEKFDGETYVRVTGWFAKEENAREVYNRLVKESPSSHYSTSEDNTTRQYNSFSQESSNRTYHFKNSQNNNNFTS